MSPAIIPSTVVPALQWDHFTEKYSQQVLYQHNIAHFRFTVQNYDPIQFTVSKKNKSIWFFAHHYCVYRTIPDNDTFELIDDLWTYNLSKSASKVFSKPSQYCSL